MTVKDAISKGLKFNHDGLTPDDIITISNLKNTMKITWTGGMLEFVAVTFLFLFVGIFTFGLIFPFMLYWQIKYVVEHITIN